MRTIHYMLVLLVGLSALGCDTHKSPNKAGPVELQEEQPVRIIYGGYDEGCKAHYNPMFCADKYNPANLNAEADFSAEVYIKDKDGNTIVLDKNQTKKVFKILREK